MLTMISASSSAIHHGSCGVMRSPPRPRDLDDAAEIFGVLERDAGDAGAQAAVYAGPKRDRVAVRADRDEVAGRDRALPGVGGRELELRLRPLELELRDALDGGAGEKRLVRDKPDLSAL